MAKKTVLITGINGFLGSNLAQSLSRDYHIIGLEKDFCCLNNINNEQFKVYSSDQNPEIIFQENQLFAIVHAATKYNRNDESLEALINTNILLPVKLFELANQYDVSLFINTDTFFNNPDYQYSYLSAYTLSKSQVLDWFRNIKGSTKLINMKLFHIYGPNDAMSKFIPSIISRIKNNEASIDLTNGEQERDFVYIDDVINAYKVVLNRFDSLEGNHITIETGTGNATSIKELVIKVKELSNSTSRLNFGALPQRSNEIMHAIANNEVLKSLGWRQKSNLESNLLKIIDLSNEQ